MEVLKEEFKGVFRLYFKDDYIVEITSEKESVEFWLFRNPMGIKMFMFGLVDETNSIDELIELAKIKIKEYISIYKEDYEEENLIEEFIKNKEKTDE